MNVDGMDTDGMDIDGMDIDGMDTDRRNIMCRAFQILEVDCIMQWLKHEVVA